MKFRGLMVTAVVACAVGWAGRSVTPMGPMSTRSEMKVISDKEFTYSMYMALGGPEALAMELTYKRK